MAKQTSNKPTLTEIKKYLNVVNKHYGFPKDSPTFVACDPFAIEDDCIVGGEGDVVVSVNALRLVTSVTGTDWRPILDCFIEDCGSPFQRDTTFHGHMKKRLYLPTSGKKGAAR